MKFTYVFGLLCASVFGSTAWCDSQKNVVLFISDNQSWFDVGCYGNDVVKTPNLDRLAREGVRFEQAFATTASCGPSRAVIYSGLLTHSNGQYAHPHREHNQEIRPEVKTVFAMLKDNGYRTALLGKDHIRPIESYPIDFKPSRRRARDVNAMAEQADIFVKQDADKPFFLVVSFSDPHPIGIQGVGWGVPKPESADAYQPVQYNVNEIQVPPFLPNNDKVKEGIAGYYQQISRMDHGVGKVLANLDATGHTDDTLVIFISDHGTSEPGAMGTHYEPGVRVPFIVKRPALKNPGSTNKALVAFTDITPTILDWTETEFDKYPLHGRSILPVLEQKTPSGWEHALLSHVGHDVFAHYPMRTLRGQRYKLIWNVLWRAEYPLPIDTVQRRTWADNRASGSKMLGNRTIDAFLHRPQLELYDLQNDPWEINNLSSSSDPKIKAIHDQMVAELTKRLQAQADPWMRKYHPLKAGQ